ncbi:hypothetical protein V865_007121 [Kwoniella europaea PYCC6329]|uniref:Uncharacterized protein n=1 Tax=Kwoniella europaea PYCC6329 TaxID=1423913 RepID=A0AAX4KRC6_9TREE
METAANNFKYVSQFPEASDTMHANIGFPGQWMMPFSQEPAHPEDEPVSRTQYNLTSHTVAICPYFVSTEKHTTEVTTHKDKVWGRPIPEGLLCAVDKSLREDLDGGIDTKAFTVKGKVNIQRTGRSLLSGELSFEELANWKLPDAETPFTIPNTRGGVSLEVETEGAGRISFQHVWRFPPADTIHDKVGISAESSSAEGGSGSEAVPEIATSDAGVSKEFEDLSLNHALLRAHQSTGLMWRGATPLYHWMSFVCLRGYFIEWRNHLSQHFFQHGLWTLYASRCVLPAGHNLAPI